jgi:hypothetical protein
VALSPDDLTRIAESLADIDIQGDRYNADMQARVGR